MTRRLTPFRDLVSVARLYSAMRRHRFAIVHTHTPKPGLLGQLAARAAGVPVVVNTLHGFYFHDRMPAVGAPVLHRDGEGRRALLGPHPVAERRGRGDGAAARHRAAGTDPPARERHRRAAVRPGDASTGGRRTATREALGIAADAPGRRLRGPAGRGEGPARSCSTRCGSWCASCPGSGCCSSAVRTTRRRTTSAPSAAAARGIEDVCVFAGVRQDMPELYAAMDVFTLPSHREGFPRAPMEASAMKVPCVVTDVRGCRQAVAHGRNGLLVPPGDAAALARRAGGAPARSHPRAAAGRGRTPAGARRVRRAARVRAGAGRVRPTAAEPRPGCARARGAGSGKEVRVSRVADGVKAAIDRVAAASALILLAPLLAGGRVLPCARTSGPPVLFRQRRPGRDGEPFVLREVPHHARRGDGPDGARLTAARPLPARRRASTSCRSCGTCCAAR